MIAIHCLDVHFIYLQLCITSFVSVHLKEYSCVEVSFRGYLLKGGAIFQYEFVNLYILWKDEKGREDLEKKSL